MRIGRRIGVIETGDEADVDDVAVHAVDPAAAERVAGQRRAERVNHVARREPAGRNLPQLLDADRVHLRIAIAIEPEFRDRRLGQRAARALTEHDDFREQIGTGFVVRFVAAVGRDALVADAHADHALAVPQQFLAGKRREHVGARRFGFLAEPLREAVERGDVFAVVVEHRRRERRFDLAARGEEPHLIAAHRRVESGRDVFARKEFEQRLRIDDGAGETVIPDLAALLDHHDREFAAGRLRELAEADRAGQTRRAAADEEDVDLEGIALRHDSRSLRRRAAAAPRRPPRGAWRRARPARGRRASRRSARTARPGAPARARAARHP